MALKEHWEEWSESQKLRYCGIVFVIGVFLLISSGFLISDLLRMLEFKKNPVTLMGYIESKRSIYNKGREGHFEYVVSYKVVGKIERTKVSSTYSFLRIQDSVKLYYIPARKEAGFITDVTGSYNYFGELALTFIFGLALTFFLVFPGTITSLPETEY